MLQKLSEAAAECQRRAREAKERADGAADPTVKSNDLERRWLLLAKSRVFTQRVADFNAETRRRIAAFRPPHPALPIVHCPGFGKTLRLTQTGVGSRRREGTSFVCGCGEALTLTTKTAD